MSATLPNDSAERKRIPITTGVLDYFPLAIAAVARVSMFGNDKHNPGEPLHWSRDKSADHADCIGRHLIDRGTLDKDGQSHTAQMTWRALALLELEEEARIARETHMETLGYNLEKLKEETKLRFEGVM